MKKITEKMLLDGFDGITNGLDNISIVDGQKIWWNYRRGETGDGYNPVVGDREEAREISLENDRIGVIPLDDENKKHEMLMQIHSERARIVGNMI